MIDATLKGTITAIVTPFKNDLSIDFDAFEKLVNFQIDSGIEGIVVCGSTGESATLSSKEKLSLIIKAVEIANGRTAIIAGTGSNDTAASIDMTLLAKESGADGVLLVAPYYNKPSQEGLFNHYLAISEAVDIPQIIYNVPGRAGINISAETQLKIAENCKNVIATKEASGDLEQMAEIMKYAPEGFVLFCGDDALALPSVSIGSSGVISVISNYVPKEFGDLIRLALSGNFLQAKELHYKLLDLMQINFIESNPVPAKAILNLMGKLENNVRLPLTPITAVSMKKIKTALLNVGIIK
ncbi:MAG: 4-hydroxy-tetrahydrodipicolinate synthase [Candidatus Kapabacteria bacterium]|nr:4-hydroxy-tetrahydrodipicolinate synthase [Ignavibacteriota bacterium]MCW5884565.1 4-hydroxy-tetrahydrodipicolinate synthase [Candidatus Kapabacteria bacterium]